MLLPDAYGRQRCNVVLSACSVVYLRYICLVGCALVMRGQQQQTIFTGTYVQNRPHTEKPGKSSYPLPAEKKTLRARHASFSARIELKPRPQVPDGLPVSTSFLIVFWLKVLVRRHKFQNRRNITNIRIHTPQVHYYSTW